MDMYCTHLIREKGKSVLRENFVLLDFIDFSCQVSEGACPFHKIELSGPTGIEFSQYVESVYHEKIQSQSAWATYEKEQRYEVAA